MSRPAHSTRKLIQECRRKQQKNNSKDVVEVLVSPTRSSFLSAAPRTASLPFRSGSSGLDRAGASLIAPQHDGESGHESGEYIEIECASCHSFLIPIEVARISRCLRRMLDSAGPFRETTTRRIHLPTIDAAVCGRAPASHANRF